MLGKGFFLTESHNPDLPPEEWTLFYEKTTAGSDSTTLPWGKYKIVISGAGGGGAAAGWNESSGTRYANNGYKGEEKTIYVNVDYGNTLAINGIIGAGGGGAAARIEHTNYNYAGAGGTGYQNGSSGTIQRDGSRPDFQASTSGGGGGGSTRIEWNNNVQSVANGGNGGTARYYASKGFAQINIWGYGGTGGSGGTTAGTGAAGGTGSATYGSSQQYGGKGTDGYVKIYVSNLKPGQN